MLNAECLAWILRSRQIDVLKNSSYDHIYGLVGSWLLGSKREGGGIAPRAAITRPQGAGCAHLPSHLSSLSCLCSSGMENWVGLRLQVGSEGLSVRSLAELRKVTADTEEVTFQARLEDE